MNWQGYSLPLYSTDFELQSYRKEFVPSRKQILSCESVILNTKLNDLRIIICFRKSEVSIGRISVRDAI